MLSKILNEAIEYTPIDYTFFSLRNTEPRIRITCVIGHGGNTQTLIWHDLMAIPLKKPSNLWPIVNIYSNEDKTRAINRKTESLYFLVCDESGPNKEAEIHKLEKFSEELRDIYPKEQKRYSVLTDNNLYYVEVPLEILKQHLPELASNLAFTFSLSESLPAVNLCREALKNSPSDEHIFFQSENLSKIRIIYNLSKEDKPTAFPKNFYPSLKDPNAKILVVPNCYFLICSEDQTEKIEKLAQFLRSCLHRDDYQVLKDDNSLFLMLPIELVLVAGGHQHEGVKKARDARKASALQDSEIKQDNKSSILEKEVMLLALYFNGTSFMTFDGQCNPMKAFKDHLTALCKGTDYSVVEGKLFYKKNQIGTLPNNPNEYYAFLRNLGVIYTSTSQDKLKDSFHIIEIPEKQENNHHCHLAFNEDLSKAYNKSTGAQSISPIETPYTIATLPLKFVIDFLSGNEKTSNLPHLTQEESILAVLKDINARMSILDRNSINYTEQVQLLLDLLPDSAHKYTDHPQCPLPLKNYLASTPSSPNPSKK